MKNLSVAVKSIVASLALIGAGAAQAIPVIGTANLSIGLVEVTLGNINFNPDSSVVALPAASNPTDGVFSTQAAANTGSFADLAFGSLLFPTYGFIDDMNAGTFPVDTAVSITKFLEFLAKPTWLFTATFLAEGNAFPGAPYNVEQLGSNVFASFSVKGTICDTLADLVCDPTDDVTLFELAVSTQYADTTIAALTQTLLDGNALPNNTWSGTLVATANEVPEPGSIALIGLGLLGLSVLRGRKQKA